MYLYGSFVNRLGEVVTVHILTHNSRIRTLEIGSEASGIYFTDDPVEITSEVNDTFDVLLRSSATIRLFSSEFLGDLFCASPRDAAVNIVKNGKCVFAGFIEPQTYEQSFNEVADEIEINCIDALSALSYENYLDSGTPGVIYSDLVSGARIQTFRDIIMRIWSDARNGLSIIDSGTPKILYDSSKALSGNSIPGKIFSEISVSEILFLGDDEEDVWKKDEVLESVLKYLNLHIEQIGFDFYIFSWDTIKTGGYSTWINLYFDTENAKQIAGKDIEIIQDIVADCDTTISIGEVYNRLSLTCDIKNLESLIESPLDSDSLTSPYANRQKYMTEFSSHGEGIRAHEAFYEMIHGESFKWEKAEVTDWFIQLKNNPNWEFPHKLPGGTEAHEKFNNGCDQQELLNYLSVNPGAALVSFGSSTTKVAGDDNNPKAKLDMTDYLAIAVNGNEVDQDGDGKKVYPDESTLRTNAPVAIYQGPSNGILLSPADDEITNYIVISGSLILNPIMDFTDSYRALKEDETWRKAYYALTTVPSRENDDGRYYTQKYWAAQHPLHEPQWDMARNRGFIPFTDTGPQKYEFKYSAVGDKSDRVSKVAVLACMLIIGDKCLIEEGTEGSISDFLWKPYKPLEECSGYDEYYQQSFTIGFDPKIGDYLVGTEFKIQNNINFSVGIDAEGLAIPVRKKDGLSGSVRFMVLGPVNTVWDEVTRRHPTFFRHTQWGTNSVSLLSHVSNILLKSFEMKVYSDNGHINNFKDEDLIYVSDTKETFINEKDDISFKISSALTLAESRVLGVADTLKLSTPLQSDTRTGITSINDRKRHISAKPEQLYVDAYYKEYSSPKVIMRQNFDDKDSVVCRFNRYTHPAMEKRFFVQGISRNLIAATALLTLKEIDQ